MTKQLFTQRNLIFVKVYPVAFALWSAPCLLRTLVGSVPSTSFNILQHPSSSFPHLPTPLGTSAPRLLGHFCMSSGCHSWFCHFCSCIAHCSICPGNHQLRSSNDPQEENMTLKTRLQTYMLWKNKDPRGSRGPTSKMSTTSCRNSQMRKDM